MKTQFVTLPLPRKGKDFWCKRFQQFRSGSIDYEHSHNEFELCLCLDSPGIFSVGSQKIPIRKGDIFFTAGGTPHQPYYSSSNNHGGVVIYFASEFLEQIAASTEWQTTIRLLNANGFFRIEGETKLTHLIKEIHLAFSEDSYSSDLKCKGLLLQIVGRILAIFENQKELLGLPMDNLQLVTSYIDKNFKESISIEHLIQISAMSRPTFYRQFEQRFGIPPSVYILQKRLSLAKTLLANRALKVSEVAGRCGFESVSYFSKAFKLGTGMSPSIYRQQAIKS